jgi:hypothetical protein
VLFENKELGYFNIFNIVGKPQNFGSARQRADWPRTTTPSGGFATQQTASATKHRSKQNYRMKKPTEIRPN